MTAATVALITVGAVIAFWAGRRWQHNHRTWVDHRKAAALAQDLAKLRWRTLWAALIAVLLLAAYLAGNGVLAAGVRPPQPRPAQTCKPASARTLRSVPPCPPATP